MANYSGKTVGVTLGGSPVYIFELELNKVVGDEEVTDGESQPWEDFIATTKRLEGSFTGNYKGAAPCSEGDTPAAVFTTGDSADTVSCTILVTKVSYPSSTKGKQTFKVEFKSKGAVTGM